MTTLSQTFQLTRGNVYAVCDSITAAIARGETVEVNGHQVYNQFGAAATVYPGTGSLAYSVRQKSNPHRSTDRYIKQGETATIVHSS